MPDNQSAVPVSQRAREARANRKHLIDLLRREAAHGGVWFASHLDTAANLLESECTAEVDALRVERDRLREATRLLKELRDNIGAASLARNPVGISIRDRVDIFLRAALTDATNRGEG